MKLGIWKRDRNGSVQSLKVKAFCSEAVELCETLDDAYNRIKSSIEGMKKTNHVNPQYAFELVRTGFSIEVYNRKINGDRGDLLAELWDEKGKNEINLKNLWRTTK